MLEIVVGKNLEPSIDSPEEKLEQSAIISRFLQTNLHQGFFHKDVEYYFETEIDDTSKTKQVTITFEEDLLLRKKAKASEKGAKPSNIKLNVVDNNNNDASTSGLTLFRQRYRTSSEHYSVTFDPSKKLHVESVTTKSRKIATIKPRPKESEEEFKKRVVRRFSTYQIFTDDKNSQIIFEGKGDKIRATLCMKYLYGVDLDEALIKGIIDKLPIEKRLEYVIELAELLIDMHSKKYIDGDTKGKTYVHGDLKGSNIIYKDPASEPDAAKYPKENAQWHLQPTFKLIDLESSATTEAYQQNKLIDTEKFTVQSCAPEIFSAAVYKGLGLEYKSINTAFDIYSFAFVLIAFIFGKDAIQRQTEGKLTIPLPKEHKDWSKQRIEKLLDQDNIAKDKRYRLTVNKKMLKNSELFPKPIRRALLDLLLNKCQATEPKDRPTAEEILQQLKGILKTPATEKENPRKRSRIRGLFGLKKSGSSSDLVAARKNHHRLNSRLTKTI